MIWLISPPSVVSRLITMPATTTIETGHDGNRQQPRRCGPRLLSWNGHAVGYAGTNYRPLISRYCMVYSAYSLSMPIFLRLAMKSSHSFNGRVPVMNLAVSSSIMRSMSS